MKLTPPNKSNVTSSYRIPGIDHALGRTTLKWTTDDGQGQRLSACLRFTDYEKNLPSAYSLWRLPYVLQTWLRTRKSPLLKKPVPFLVMDAIRHLDKMIQPGMKVLEAGGGNSSLWFLSKGVELITYEHSAEWASHIRDAAPANRAQHTLKVMQGAAATADMAAIADHSLDMVLVDCMNDYTRRNDCIRVLISKVKPGGLFILDNSDNPVNWIGADLLKDKKKKRFTGFAPMGLFVCQTTIWTM